MKCLSREQNSYSQGVQGTGLGMAIYEADRGSRWAAPSGVESEPGEGTPPLPVELSIRLSRPAVDASGRVAARMLVDRRAGK
ncbi:MAG: hypothetical protein ACLSAC_29520 [Enterocloster bolteae]